MECLIHADDRAINQLCDHGGIAIEPIGNIHFQSEENDCNAVITVSLDFFQTVPGFLIEMEPGTDVKFGGVAKPIRFHVALLQKN